MMVYVLINLLLNKTMIQTRLNQHQKWAKAKYNLSMTLAFLFPAHFVSISAIITKIKYVEQQEAIEDHLKNGDLTDPEEFQRTFTELSHSLKEAKSEYVKVTKFKQANSRVETILEVLPSSILLISIGVMSNVYPTLKYFVNTNKWLEFFGLSFEGLLVIMSLKIALSLGTAALKIRYDQKGLFIHCKVNTVLSNFWI